MFGREGNGGLSASPSVSRLGLPGRGGGGEGGWCSSAWPLVLQLEGPVSL